MPAEETVVIHFEGDAAALAAALAKAIENSMGKAIDSIAKELRDALGSQQAVSKSAKRFEDTMGTAIRKVAQDISVNMIRSGRHAANETADAYTSAFRGMITTTSAEMRRSFENATTLGMRAAASVAAGTGATTGSSDLFVKEMRSAIAHIAQDMRRVLGGSAAQSAASSAADAFTTEMRSAIARIALDMRRVFARAMAGATGAGPGGAGGFGAGFAAAGATATSTIRDMGQALGHTGDRLDEFVRDFQKINPPTQEMLRFNHLQEQVQLGFRELGDAIRRFGVDSAQTRIAAQNLEIAQRAAKLQGDQFGKLTVTQRTELAKQAEDARVTAQGITSAMKAETSERIVLTQTEAAREIAITKRSAQQRVEIIRAVVGQIRALERGIAAVFRTSASAFGRLTSAAARSVGQLGSIFSRSNREMTTGLSSAMNRREGIFRSSMSRQERIIQSSVIRQSAQFTRLEAASSRGIAGVVSGRSQLGGLIGGGLAIGGGIGLITTVKRLVTVSADFEQAMAVLDAQLGLTDKQMENIRQTSIDLGNDISLPGVSAKDAGEAIQNLVKQFGSMGKQAPRAAQAAAKGVLQLSRATGADAEQAASLVGSAVNVFGISADKAVQVADEIVGALKVAAGTGFDDFALAFKAGASVFNQFQGPALGAEETLVEFNVALAAMAQSGLRSQVAGDALKNFFTQATRNAAPAKKALELISERAGVTGTAFFDAAGAARPFGETIEILRAGLKGMTDQQRASTIQTLFGNDASRAANALLRVQPEQYDKIRRSVREQGLAAKIAAAQNTGLRGAMDALGSMIDTIGIEVLPKITVPLGNLVLSFAEFANNLRTGEGIFATTRTVLKGIALGLGSILAAKGAIEVFRFLLILARGLLTPLGLISVLAAGLGAAFTLMTDKSQSFRDAMSDVRDRLGDLAEKGIQFVKDRLGDLADFLGGTVLPKLAAFAETAVTFLGDVFSGSDVADAWARGMEGIDTRTLGEKIGDKIRDIIDVVRNAATTAISFIGDVFSGSDINDRWFQIAAGIDTRTIGEKIGDKIREIFSTAFGFARGVVGNVQELFGDLLFGVDFGDALAQSVAGADTRSTFERIGGTIRSALEPAIDAVGAFKDALVDLFKVKPSSGFLAIGGVLAGIAGGFVLAGPVGAAIGGLGAGIAALFATGLGDELVGVFDGIGTVIINALKGPLESVKDFITGFFTVDNLMSISFAFLDVVEDIGRILGSIASDPRLIAALAAIAGLAAATAVRFVEGFAQGVIENVPEVASMIRDALGEAINQAFSLIGIDFDFGGNIVTALAVAIGGAKAISLLVTAANKLGLATGQAIGAAVQKGTAGALTVGGAGLGGGPRGLIQGLLGGPSAIASAGRDAGRIAGAVEQQFRRNLVLIRATGGSTFDSIKTFAEKGFAAGLRASETAKRGIVANLGEQRTAGVQMSAAIRDMGTSIGKLNFRGVVTGFGDLRAAMAGQGRAIGAAAGTAIAGALGVAFGVQMLREGNEMVGVLTIIGSALTAFAVGGGPLGVLTLGLGFLAAAFQQTTSDAEAMDERVKGLAETLRGATDPVQKFADDLITRFSDLDPELQSAFGNLDFHLDEILAKVSKGATPGWVLGDMIAKRVPEMGELMEEFGIRALGSSDVFGDPKWARGAAALEELEISEQDLIDMTNFLETATGDYAAARELAGVQERAFGESVRGTTAALEEADPKMRAFHTGLGVALSEPDDKVSPKIEEVHTQLFEIVNQADAATTAIATMFGFQVSTNLEDALAGLVTKIPGLISAISGLDLSTALGKAEFSTALDSYVTDFGTTFSDLIADQEITTVPQFKMHRREAIAAFEETVGDALERGEITPKEAFTLVAEFKEAVLGIPRARIEQMIRDAIGAVEPEVTVNVRGKPRLTFPEGAPPRAIASGLQDWFDTHEAPQVTLTAKGLPKLTIPDTVKPPEMLKLIRDWLGEQDPPRVNIPTQLNWIYKVDPEAEDPVAAARRLARRRIRDIREGHALLVPLPIKPKPTVNDEDKPTLEDLRNLLLPSAGPGGTPGFGEARGFAAADAIEVPIPIKPTVTVTGGAQTDIGTGIAAQIAGGITAAAPQISAALNTAIGQALRSGSQLTSTFSIAGAAAAGSFATGLTSQQSAARAAASGVASASLGGFTGFSAFFAGSDLSATFASGISSGSGSASGAASSVGSGAVGSFFGFSAYSAGLNLSNSMAQGISDGQSAVINAAIRIAQAAINAARQVLQVSSPSRVFRNIGHDIGSGLAEGIRDSETAISSAVDSAIDDAIERARRQVGGQRVARAELAGGLFERTTLPSRLPGGVTDIDVARSFSSALDAMHELVDLQREQNRELEEFKDGLRQEIKDTRVALAERLASIEENALAKLLDAFEARAEGLDVARQRVDLGGLRGQFAKAFLDLIPEFKPEKAVEGESAQERRDREARNRAAQERHDEALANARALRINTAAGRATTNMILDFGEQIRALGASMLESGASASEVRNTMERYVDQLIAAARAQGINGQALRDLIQTLGLTDAQLARFSERAREVAQNARQAARDAQREADRDILRLQQRIQNATGGSRALGTGTAAGRENRAIISDALEGIREFGRTALEAGRPTAEVVARMKEMRQELVRSAVNMGFNSEQVKRLVELMGLSNEQLAQFAANLADANAEIPGVPSVPPGTGGNVIGPGGRLPVGIRDVHVHVPFGDPEATALAVSNRMAFEMAAPV